MKASLLINSAGAIAASVRSNFSVERIGHVQLFQHGLAGAETALVELLASDVDPDSKQAVDGLWITVATLAPNAALLSTLGPGNYRVRVEASAGAVVVGIYGS